MKNVYPRFWVVLSYGCDQGKGVSLHTSAAKSTSVADLDLSLDLIV